MPFGACSEPNRVIATQMTNQSKELSKNLKRAALIVLPIVILVWYLTAGKERALVFVGGAVYTMDGSDSVAEAVLVEGGVITAIGSTEKVRSQAPLGARVIELNGRALLPGFVDAHSHFPVGVIDHLGVQLSATATEPVVNNNELLKRVAEAVKITPSGQWIVGFKYDNTLFPSGQHPNRQQLDQLSLEHPIYLRHISGHMGVANTAALQELQIDNKDDALRPFIEIDTRTGELTGLLQEAAAPSLGRFFRNYSMTELFNAYKLTREEYLAAGVSTVQNGLINGSMTKILKLLQMVGLLPQRVVTWVNSDYAGSNRPRYTTNFRQATVKLIVDGSPQGRTAFLTKPYHTNSPSEPNFRGAPLLTQEQLDKYVLYYHQAGYQIALHGNGDAAIDMIIAAVARAQQSMERPDARHILVHAQTIRRDQISQLSALSITPSFFNAHTFYWGDWHQNETLGPERAQHISPLADVVNAGVRFSLHSDAPVTPIQPMHLVWNAINRQTRSGDVLGRAQQISLTSALRAITIDAAWQSHVDHDRGSIELGKLADLVVLSGDPYAVDDLRTMLVDLTYIGGEEVFAR